MAIPTRSNLTKNPRDFVYFSSLTTGTSGRAVKIHKDLFLPFFCTVDPTTHEGKTVISQIESLKSVSMVSAPSPRASQSVKHVTRLANIRNAFEHVLVTKRVQVYYKISEETGDKAPCVYITGFKSIQQGVNEQAGLYEQKSRKFNSGSTKRIKNNDLSGRTVYINGLAENIDTAITNAHSETGRNDTALFYSPASVSNELGTWSTSIRTHSSQQAVDELSSVLKYNQNPKKEISWVIEGSGAALLSKTLKETPCSLKNHKFKLINAETNTPELISTLNNKNASLTGEFFNYSRNKSALIAIAFHKEELIKQIGLLPASKGYDTTTRRHITKQIDALGNNASSVIQQNSQVHGKKATFVQALENAGAFRK